MTARCTEPERWATPPGSDASEEDVERYLAHIGECAFHAAMEKRDVERMRAIAAVAKSVQQGRHQSLPGEEAARRRKRLGPLGLQGADRRSAFIRSFLIASWSSRATAAALAVGVVIVAVLLVTNFLRWAKQPDHIAQHVEQAQPREEGNFASPPSELESPNVNSNAVIPLDQRSAPRPQPELIESRRRGFNNAPAVGNAGVLPRRRAQEEAVESLVSVRRVYVSAGESEYDRQLRDALVAALQQSERFTVATGEKQAQAVLRSEQTRGKTVTVQLMDRAQKVLWHMTEPTASESTSDIRDTASEIVTALLKETEKLERLRAAPRP